MIKNKHIITITLLTSLLASRVSKSQEFYTCVPKKSWWKDTIKESVSNSKHNIVDRLTSAQSLINVNSVWNLVADNNTQGTLNAGIYKVVVAGASGGKGGDSDSDNSATNKSVGAIGGAGEIIEKIFQINQSVQYFSCIGKKGSDANQGIGTGGGGGGGAGSSFVIDNINLLINVSGGGGGAGSGENENFGGSGGGGGYGCAKGGDGGEDSYDKKFVSGGNIIGSLKNKFNFNVEGQKGYHHENGRGLGGKTCANGGNGNNYKYYSENGSTCAVSGKENFGNGYVKIYKYIG